VQILFEAVADINHREINQSNQPEAIVAMFYKLTANPLTTNL